ncbi:MAG TPA: hypothetical protein PKN33_08900 [Phycisphaerae bacterium]|nr:hypothetical protein [Phycisphaerae bacterium]
MTDRHRWDRCIHHRGADATAFIDEYFTDSERRVLLIGGAGFDPRSLTVPERLAASCGERVSGLFFREERPNADEGLREQADCNDARIRELIPGVDIVFVDVFDIDNAPIGGRRATRELHERMDLQSITDVVLDCSALSVGVMFPIARYCFEATRRLGPAMNFHLVVLDDPQTDSAIRATACGKVAPLHAFSGGLNLDSNKEAARLWLPQLGTGRREFLNLIFQEIRPHAVCPIIPFPSRNPRWGDGLLEEYGDLFEAVSDPMTPTWNVDSRDIVYTHEKSPLDLYRSILRIDEARTRVFAQTGGSRIILSPLGSKAVGVGILLAALERDFAVVSVETIEYQFEVGEERSTDDADLVHLWLHGDAYNVNQEEQDGSHGTIEAPKDT